MINDVVNTRTRFVSAGLAAAALLLAGSAVPLGAQEGHVVGRSEVERATAEADRSEAAQRAAIRSVLDREEVRSAAEASGIDLVEAREAVATLEGDELDRVATRASELDRALAGGDGTVVIGTTTLIIALLVLIIILVA